MCSVQVCVNSQNEKHTRAREGTKEIPAERNLRLGVIGPCPTHIRAQQPFLKASRPMAALHTAAVESSSLTLYYPDNVAQGPPNNFILLLFHSSPPSCEQHSCSSLFIFLATHPTSFPSSQKRKNRHSSKRHFEHCRTQERTSEDWMACLRWDVWGS